jgi:hypothetical protein
MAWKPRFRLYASNGSTLVYEFEHVQSISGWPSDEPSSIEITNLRSQGSIQIAGGLKSYDITLQGILQAADYSALTTAILSLRDTVDPNTNYVLKLDKTSTTTDDINVVRVVPIVFEDSQRTRFQKYTVTFRANAW